MDLSAENASREAGGSQSERSGNTLRKRGAQKGRVMSDAQREGLKKGLEALKAKREAIAKEKEQLKKPIAECLQSKPIVASTECLPAVEKPEKPLPKVEAPLPTINQEIAPTASVNPPPLVKPKKVSQPKVNITDFAKFKEDVIQNISQIKSAPPQEKVVEKQVYLTGSALLNKIFNFNS